jgi:hypothetical protein
MLKIKKMEMTAYQSNIRKKYKLSSISPMTTIKQHLSNNNCYLLLCQFLPRINIRILSPLEGTFQLLQLVPRECGPTAPLFSLQGNSRLRFCVRLVSTARTCEHKYFMISFQGCYALRSCFLM